MPGQALTSCTHLPQLNITCLITAQLVGGHFCGIANMKGLDILLFKATKDHLGACCQAFFMALQKLPKASHCSQGIFFFSFIKAPLVSFWSSKITCKVEEYLVPFPHITSFCSVLKWEHEKGTKKLKTLN